MSLAESRKELARRQAAMLQALTGGPNAVTGVERLPATADALLTKRVRAVARVWPALARSLGEQWEPRFREFARRTPLPESGGPLADGRAFARELDDLSDEARMEMLSVDLHWKRRGNGLVLRRGPALKATRLRQAGRLMIAVRLPWLGERWVSLRWIP
jgi:hypothetical protein